MILRNRSGNVLRHLGIDIDVTEQRLADETFLRNEKLAAVGRLASSMAHEINNPLESVTNLIFLAKESAYACSEAVQYLDLADRELRRVSAITAQTLRFHKQTTKPTLCFAKDLFSETIAIYQGRIVNSHIQLEEKHRLGRGVQCFEGEIRQILSNLITNAIDAMPDGGRLLLRSHETRQGLNGQEGVVFTIADTGHGMSLAVRQKLFEPFHSTKGIGGAGLGLWVSKEIVDRHRGTLNVRSRQTIGDSGTVCRLFLPINRFPQ